MGAFPNYVDKKRYLGDTVNVNFMHFFPVNSKGIPSIMSTRYKVQKLVNVFCECPLTYTIHKRVKVTGDVTNKCERNLF